MIVSVAVWLLLYTRVSNGDVMGFCLVWFFFFKEQFIWLNSIHLNRYIFLHKYFFKQKALIPISFKKAT